MASLAPGRAEAPKQHDRALREMQIYRVAELGLAIWVENQPAWRTELMHAHHPCFIAEAPPAHHPPAVFSYASWREERVAEHVQAVMARTAIIRASQNFGLHPAQSRALVIKPAHHGILRGHEAGFSGYKGKTGIDVRIFVGQGSGGFPVAMTLYTMRGKMGHLDEHVRRAWSNLTYL